MTNEQINVALAKWHTEHHKYGMKFVYGVCLDATSACGTLSTFPTYTDSLDTMRMIEELLTEEQWPAYSNAILWGGSFGSGIYIVPRDILMADAERRARAIVTALGLGSETE